MNVHALIPLIAAVAYIPLFFILLNNRPWQRQHKLFAAYLIVAVFWSLSDTYFRSNLLIAYKILLLEVVIFTFLLTCVQSHYFISSFYQTSNMKFPIAYGIPALGITLMVLGYIPETVTISG